MIEILLDKSYIAVERSEFPELDSNEYYWHQLEGLRVISIQDGIDLGVVAGLMETGANDVLEVKGDIDSLDFKERLIPYTKQVVLTVNLISKKIEVDWDAEF
jgi:16S rRNA processing protein RimM